MKSLFLYITAMLFVLFYVLGCIKEQLRYQEENYSYENFVKAPDEASLFTQLAVSDSVLYSYYKVGVDDVLQIKIFDKGSYSSDYLTREVRVRPDATIILLPIGKIKVADLSILEIEKLIVRKLEEYIHTPLCEVQIIKSESNRVVVFGEFGEFGKQVTEGAEQKAVLLKLDRPTRLTEVIAQVGGLGLNSDATHIKIIHKDGKTEIVNLDEIIFSNHLEKDVYLTGGDIIYVPTSLFNKVFVLGEVATPGIVSIKRNNTILDIISRAGGLTQKAYLATVKVVRQNSGKTEIYNVNLKRIVKNGDIKENIILCHGDIVYVPGSKLTKAGIVLSLVLQSIYLTTYPYYFINDILRAK